MKFLKKIRMKVFYFLILFFSINQLFPEDKTGLLKEEFQRILGKWKLNRVLGSDGYDPRNLIPLECANDANGMEYCWTDLENFNYMLDYNWLQVEEDRLLFYEDAKIINDCNKFHLEDNLRSMKIRFWKYVLNKKHHPYWNKLIYKPYEKIKIFTLKCSDDAEKKPYPSSYDIIHVERLNEIFITYHFNSYLYIYRKMK